MKQGLQNEQGQPDLVALLNTVKETKEAAQDFIGSTSKLFMHPDGSIEVDQGDGVHVNNDQPGAPRFTTTNHARRQICTWAKIPAQYADRCPTELLAINANHWFKNGVDADKGPVARMLRTMQPNELLQIREPTLRAFVSDIFRRIDNWDYANAVFPVLQEYAAQGLIIDSCNIGEHAMHLKGHIDGIEEVILKPGHVMGEGNNTFYRVKPGFDMRNGETGGSAISFAGGLFDTGCTNLAIQRESAQRRHHVGRSQADGELWSMLTDETQVQSNKALMMQLADYARASLDASGELFKRNCDMIREKMGLEVKRPEATFKLVGDTFGLTETEQSACVAELLTRGDMSVMGIQAAITQHSQAETVDYDRATELETIGGDVLAWGANQWDNLLQQADELKIRVAA